MTDTLILGGGLAGCAAALWLSDLGHSATIVEARPDLGGRARSREWGDCGDPVEYGGGWIRADHRQMLGLADRLGLTLTPRAPVTAHSYFRGGNAYAAPADDLTDYTAALATLQTDVAALVEVTGVDHRTLCYN